MLTLTRSPFPATGLLLLLLCGLALPSAWGRSDKTEVDLEVDRPTGTAHYHRPRLAHRYRYDATDVDLARPLPPQPASESPSPARPQPPLHAPEGPGR